ncbi:MAG: type II secretion system F family protein [Polyangiales bacterium]
MSGLLDALLSLSFVALLGGVTVLASQLALTKPAIRPTLGARGLHRADALRRGGFFALVEPMVRLLAAWSSLMPLKHIRARLQRSLVHAGDYLGLSADELIGMCALSSFGLGAVGAILCELLNLPRVMLMLAVVLGAITPWLRVLALAQARARQINRKLPSAVELAAMCMSAGLDFPGSLRRIVDSAADPNDPLIQEFSRVLQELDLGHTRKRAMEGLAARVPTDQVREFVNSVVQAEDKGSPLSSVLTIQAQTQRLRRSIAAEETASEAALMLLGPMTLIFLCVIVLLLGPVVVRFMTGGLGPT